MADKPRTSIDLLSEEIRQCLPSELQDSEEAGRKMGSLCGWFAGVFLGSQIANWIWPREEE